MTVPETKETPHYLVADLFCGAGGTSTGAYRAIEESGGSMELVCVNHWQTAVETHQANHPMASHYVADLERADPETLVPEGKLDLLMASPECRFHSRARGGKPIHDQGRMAPWTVINWLTSLDARCVLVENVPEFTNWGPWDENGKAIKSKRGEYFQAWFMAFINLGYQVQWRMLNAADYGDPTSRTRFFLIARKDGVPIAWPEPTHARRESALMPGRKPWRPAAEIIDWSNPGLSIFDDPKYRRKPLVENTLRRIAKGLERYGGHLAPLYIRLLDIPDYQCPSIASRPAHDVYAEPFIINRHGENGSERIHPTSEPAPTCTTRGSGYLARPAAEPFIIANRNGNAPHSLREDPIPPATTAPGGGIYMVQPDAAPFLLGQQSGGAPRHTDQPTPTVASGGKISIIQPSIILYYKNSDAQSIDHPLSSITAKGRKHGLVRPSIIEYYSNSDGQSIDQPLPAITTKDRHALANPSLIQVNHGNGDEGNRGNHRRVHSIDDPLPSITTRPGLYLAAPEVTDLHELQFDEPRTDINSQSSELDPRRLVTINGVPYILDIRFRMLTNRELARAMGFDDGEIRYQFHGTKTQITRQIGNAVPVRLAAALVSAILSE